MHSKLLDFLKKKNIDIQINEDRMAPLIEYDIEFCSTLFLYTLNFFAKSTKSENRRHLDRSILSIYLYLARNPGEYNKFIFKNEDNLTSSLESIGIESDVLKVWSYFEPTYRILLIRGFIVENNTQTILTADGEVYIDTLMKKHKVETALPEQAKVFSFISKYKITKKSAGLA